MRALAKLVVVDERTISAWEAAENVPASENLSALSLNLRFPEAFFFADDIDLVPAEAASFRSLKRMNAAQRDMALSSGTLATQLSEWIDQRFHLPAVDLPSIPELDPEAAAAELRARWGLGVAPVRNLVHLLESKGVRVFSLALDAVEVDAFSFWSGEIPVVLLNTRKSAEHSRFDAAHELAHLIRHRHGDLGGQELERDANAFASAFLMPRESVLARAPRFPTVDALVASKKFWNVSVAALCYRMHTVGLLSDWHYRRLFIEIGRRGYRTAEPQESPRETSQVMAKVFAALRQDGISKATVAEALLVPAEEIEELVFGLTVTGLSSPRTAPSPRRRPSLSLIGKE